MVLKSYYHRDHSSVKKVWVLTPGDRGMLGDGFVAARSINQD